MVKVFGENVMKMRPHLSGRRGEEWAGVGWSQTLRLKGEVMRHMCSLRRKGWERGN